MSHSWEPSRIVRFWLSIFWRAAASMRASCISSSSRILRTSRRMVLRSSMKSTVSISATASVTTCASLLTLARLSLTLPSSSQHRFVFLHQLGLHLTEHFLVVGAAFAHFFRVGFENHTHLVIDAVFKRQLIEQRSVHFFRERRHRLSLDHPAGCQFLGNFAGQIAHIFFGEKHVELALS